MHIRKVLLHVLPLVVSVSLTGGCAAKIARMSVDGMKPIMVEMRGATNKNRDSQLVMDAMPAMLIQMDGFIGVSPENRYLLTSAAEANMGYAFFAVEDKNKERAKFLYLKARDYALRNLMLNKTFKQGFAQDDIEVFTRALKTVHKRDVAPLFIATNSWMSWINLAHADNPSALKDLPKVEAMMDRILAIDDTYYYGGVHALLGTYYVPGPRCSAAGLKRRKSSFRRPSRYRSPSTFCGSFSMQGIMRSRPRTGGFCRHLEQDRLLAAGYPAGRCVRERGGKEEGGGTAASRRRLFPINHGRIRDSVLQ